MVLKKKLLCSQRKARISNKTVHQKETQITQRTLRLTKKAVKEVIGIVKLSAGGFPLKGRKETVCFSLVLQKQRPRQQKTGFTWATYNHPLVKGNPVQLILLGIICIQLLIKLQKYGQDWFPPSLWDTETSVSIVLIKSEYKIKNLLLLGSLGLSCAHASTSQREADVGELQNSQIF